MPFLLPEIEARLENIPQLHYNVSIKSCCYTWFIDETDTFLLT